MSEKKISLLKMLAEELELSDDIEKAEFFSKEELGAPIDITRAIVNDVGIGLMSVLAEFCFLPFEEEEMLYFATGITLTDDIRDDEKTDLMSAVSRVNSLVPIGCFALSENFDSLTYRYTVPILADTDEESIKKIMLSSVDAALTTLDRFSSFLMLVLEGNTTPDDMLHAITGSTQDNR